MFWPGKALHSGGNPYVESPRHVELGHYLRTRRERIKPETVGLPVNHRRRSPGLRREEVAFLASVSPAWYSRLEQGNKVRPSSVILDSLADALQLDDTERRYLHALGSDKISTASPPTAPDKRTVALVRNLVEDHGKLPVFAVDGRGDLISWNGPTREWYTDFGRRAGHDRNFLWWLLTAEEARVRIADWAAYARDQVAGMRYAVGTGTIDPSVQPMLDELHEHCAEFREWWETHDVVDQEVATRTFHHPRQGLRRVDLLTVRPVVSVSLSVVFHRPVT
jgi:transcriptional regulator with XRE-family HTH domain